MCIRDRYQRRVRGLLLSHMHQDTALAIGAAPKMAQHIRLVLKAMEADKLVLMEELSSMNAELGNMEGQVSTLEAQHQALIVHYGDWESLSGNYDSMETELESTRRENQILRQNQQLSDSEQALPEALVSAREEAEMARLSLFQETEAFSAVRDQMAQELAALQLDKVESAALVAELEEQLNTSKQSLQLCFQMERSRSNLERHHTSTIQVLKDELFQLTEQYDQQSLVADQAAQMIQTLENQVKDAHQETLAAKQGLEGEFATEWDCLKHDLMGQLSELQDQNMELRHQSLLESKIGELEAKLGESQRQAADLSAQVDRLVVEKMQGDQKLVKAEAKVGALEMELGQQQEADLLSVSGEHSNPVCLIQTSSQTDCTVMADCTGPHDQEMCYRGVQGICSRGSGNSNWRGIEQETV
eukprot:TRINITY_DN18552_c0_g3_i2.p1 TRINITY_DN18552_c0_g3~~TRINITY_DN18552_c0_g3_i2.p1  ORF type:complete len:416 (+),score=120.30 TRINITY_DN18552_c0_g3_i2:77-1324(+)